MSSPSDPPLSGEPDGRAPSSTQEIPVVQPAGATTAPPHLPPHPGAVMPSPVAMDEPQPTGPVDFVPGLPGTPPVPSQATPAPASVWPETLESHEVTGRSEKRRRIRVRGDRSALLGTGLAVLSLVLLELGLALDLGSESSWSTVPLWSAFATLCAVLGLLALAATWPSDGRLRSSAVWRLGAGGLVGLAIFWLLVVLPVVASDRGFLLTAALGALGAALWVGLGRKT